MSPTDPEAVDVLTGFLASHKPKTRAAYLFDLTDFARFLRVASAAGGVTQLLNLSQGDANATASGYRSHLTARGLSSASIARRLASLRSIVTAARSIGVVAWSLDVKSPCIEARRDVDGPGRKGWETMLALADREAASGRHATTRDLAIIRLLHDLGLRRNEVASLSLTDIDLSTGTVNVLGKGRTERIRLNLPGPTRDALARWISHRGDWPGPLFFRLDSARSEEIAPLSGFAINRLVTLLGRKAGIVKPVRPHGLRHEAITRALDESNGDVRSVQRFARLSSISVILAYDDRRKESADWIANMVAGGPPPVDTLWNGFPMPYPQRV